MTAGPAAAPDDSHALIGLPPGDAALVARAGRFAADELLPAERTHGVKTPADAPADLRRWVRQRSAEAGLYRLAQPAEVGGAGASVLLQSALTEEIAASGAILGGLVVGGDGGLLKLGTAEQRERFLMPVLRGETEAAFAFTDGRDGPRTTATRRGDRFVLSGVKAFVSGGAGADLLVAVARVTDNGGGPTGTAIFVVPRHAPGVRVRRDQRTLDGTLHAEIELSEVTVPAADVLGEIGAGLPRALESITTLRLHAAAVACGAGRFAVGYTLAQVDRPHRSGTPLAEREQVQAMLADSATELYAARAAVFAAARRADAGAAVDVEAAMAKALATESVARIVDRAIQLTGAAAVVEDHPLALLYRRIRSWRIGEGPTELLRLAIARGLLARHRGTA
ncbi:MAG: acyl-CoA dehydrogenase family protein [Candidatus Rokuibacteriota bacterium]